MYKNDGLKIVNEIAIPKKWMNFFAILFFGVKSTEKTVHMDNSPEVWTNTEVITDLKKKFNLFSWQNGCYPPSEKYLSARLLQRTNGGVGTEPIVA